MTCAFADPREWMLEITPTVQAQCWQQSQMYTTSGSRWRAYMNQICLYAFLDWISTLDSIQASVWYSFPGTPAFWEFVNGTAILLEERRVVLIPSEAIDDSELEVPQEWVDVPSWAADYYLAVQVNASGEWVRFWGYTTYAKLKLKANYDPIDRTYCIDARYLTKDFNAFWINYQFCKQESSIATVPSLPELSSSNAENLLQRLTDDTVTFPRLAVPFATWGALLENEQWRQRLYERLKQSRYLNLSRWLEGVYDQFWDSVETFLGSNIGDTALNFRQPLEVGAKNVKRAKLINLGMDDSTSFVLVIALIVPDNQFACIRVQLHPDRKIPYLPSNIKLAVRASGEIIQEVQAREQDNYIQLNRFEGEVGETFSIEVKMDSYQITENFVI
ncbi:hypothetical protein NIES4071_86220 [Calothrix sp. NIES-4071]|nr:hypothetical protein NIES4071_86220 [Calothrix sp. NIES-4071]BAZ62889.1 hypothetical protein NIES4105_86150 [Calothrix sp. NIES-4105]